MKHDKWVAATQFNQELVEALKTETSQINRATDKSGTFLGYSVASRNGGEPHYITWNEAESRWECTCTAGYFHRQCHAVKAVNAVILANRPERTPAAPVVRGTLNGSSSGYSLLK